MYYRGFTEISSNRNIIAEVDFSQQCVSVCLPSYLSVCLVAVVVASNPNTTTTTATSAARRITVKTTTTTTTTINVLLEESKILRSRHLM